MGWSISWTAVRGESEDQALSHFNLARTGRFVATTEPGETVATLAPGGWTLVGADDFDSPLFQQTSLAQVAKRCELVTVRVEEHIMYSSPEYWRNGEQEWFLSHDNQKGRMDLTAVGRAPGLFAEVKAHLLKQQRDYDAANHSMRVDFLFDVPVETAARVVGFRHDRDFPAWDGSLPFEIVTPRRTPMTTPL